MSIPINNKKKYNYGTAILAGFEYLLSNYPEVFVIGQGLWSPWYVGNSMTDLDKKFGVKRIIDTPVSESACTGAAVGASLANMKPIIVHPRMDFMLYSMDAIINQAAKWSHMFKGQAHPCLTIRGIINRGGQQGAQHSQSLHSLFAHIPGLRVVMPYSVSDARDLLIASVLCKDPVLFIDDRWLYESEEELDDVTELNLLNERPKLEKEGKDITFVGSSYSTKLALDARKILLEKNISAEVIDIRVLNPLNPDLIIKSVMKTKRLIAIDGSWQNCGFASEIIATVSEKIPVNTLLSPPLRITLPPSPAPCSDTLEKVYYPSACNIVDETLKLFI